MLVQLLRVSCSHVRKLCILHISPLVSPINMSILLQQPRLQNLLNSLWKILLEIDLSCADLERSIKALSKAKANSNASSNSPLNLFRSKSLDVEEDFYVEETFMIPGAILVSSLQVKKCAVQRRIQTLLANIAGSDETEELPEKEDRESSELISRAKILLSSIDNFCEKKIRENEKDSGPLLLETNVCNMICKSPSSICFKNGRWIKRTAGIGSDDCNSQYVEALHRRLRRQCKNMILLQQERNGLLLENKEFKESRCNECRKSVGK